VRVLGPGDRHFARLGRNYVDAARQPVNNSHPWVIDKLPFNFLYCGLRWKHECLEFRKSRNASTTASAAQVRQPIYSSSVQKWRNYEEQLAPLQARLSDAGLI